MDPFTELVALAIVAIGVPVLLTRVFCRSVVREIASWGPAKIPIRLRYHLVQVIPQRTSAPTSMAGNWSPAEGWHTSSS